jgi:hypothetical protein
MTRTSILAIVAIAALGTTCLVSAGASARSVGYSSHFTAARSVSSHSMGARSAAAAHSWNSAKRASFTVKRNFANVSSVQPSAHLRDMARRRAVSSHLQNLGKLHKPIDLTPGTAKGPIVLTPGKPGPIVASQGKPPIVAGQMKPGPIVAFPFPGGKPGPIITGQNKPGPVVTGQGNPPIIVGQNKPGPIGTFPKPGPIITGPVKPGPFDPGKPGPIQGNPPIIVGQTKPGPVVFPKPGPIITSPAKPGPVVDPGKPGPVDPGKPGPVVTDPGKPGPGKPGPIIVGQPMPLPPVVIVNPKPHPIPFPIPPVVSVPVPEPVVTPVAAVGPIVAETPVRAVVTTPVVGSIGGFMAIALGWNESGAWIIRKGETLPVAGNDAVQTCNIRFGRCTLSDAQVVPTAPGCLVVGRGEGTTRLLAVAAGSLDAARTAVTDQLTNEGLTAEIIDNACNS